MSGIQFSCDVIIRVEIPIRTGFNAESLQYAHKIHHWKMKKKKKKRKKTKTEHMIVNKAPALSTLKEFLCNMQQD